ncbi:MAG: tetratricopeptide repeat protein [Planctomycetota bacterium]|nr:tetratricopeptide repeat protein [Planctomycetota bacterium]MDA1138021.1 tetratricopeptide repeat protein [Planctomycetota bacterium]
MSEKRLNFLKRAVESDPNAEMSRYGLAMELMSIEEFKESEMHFKKLIEIHPKYVPGHFMLGKLYSKMGEPEQARATLEHGIEVAEEVGNMHAAGEMQEELDMLE